MPLAFDISADFSVFDAAEPVTYTRRNLDGTTAATYAPVSAIREVDTSAPIGVGQGGARALVTSARWLLKASDMPLRPMAGDQFATDDGSTWEVMDCSSPPLGAPYACNCKRVG